MCGIILSKGMFFILPAVTIEPIIIYTNEDITSIIFLNKMITLKIHINFRS